MTTATQAWLVKDATGALVTAYWYEDDAGEYLEEHPDEGLTVERIDVTWSAP